MTDLANRLLGEISLLLTVSADFERFGVYSMLYLAKQLLGCGGKWCLWLHASLDYQGDENNLFGSFLHKLDVLVP